MKQPELLDVLVKCDVTTLRIADAAREYVAARARAAEDRFSSSSLELQLRVDRAWAVLNEICQGDTPNEDMDRG